MGAAMMRLGVLVPLLSFGLVAVGALVGWGEAQERRVVGAGHQGRRALVKQPAPIQAIAGRC